MPAYISHSIMGDDFYNRFNKDEKIFKIDVSHDSLKTYSLGIDLANFSKTTIDFHNYLTDEFLIRLVNNINNLSLKEDAKGMSLLYGHIGHYFLDIVLHPLIYYIEKGTEKTGLFSSHQLVEGYIDQYLCKKILEKDLTDINCNYFLKGHSLNRDINNFVDKTYFEVYKVCDMHRSYEKTLKYIEILESIIKFNGVDSSSFLKIVSCYNSFLRKNNLCSAEIVNELGDFWMHPVTGEIHNETLLQLYDKAIEMTAEAIDVVNKCIYDEKSINNLNKIFTGISYDTAVPCSLGKNFIYTRKLKQKSY